MFFEALAMTVAAFCANAADVMPKAAIATAAFHVVAIVSPTECVRSAPPAGGSVCCLPKGRLVRIMEHRLLLICACGRRLLKPRCGAALVPGSRLASARSRIRLTKGHPGGAMTDQLSRRDFLGVAAGTAAAALSAPRAAHGQERPNVLFILADDLGYGDLSSYGRPDYSTPVLDHLATQGMKFTSAYAAAPVCTPTRVAFMTGRYPQRYEVGLQEPLTASSPPVGLPAGQPTVASRMRAAGYETAPDRQVALGLASGVSAEPPWFRRVFRQLERLGRLLHAYGVRFRCADRGRRHAARSVGKRPARRRPRAISRMCSATVPRSSCCGRAASRST